MQNYFDECFEEDYDNINEDETVFPYARNKIQKLFQKNSGERKFLKKTLSPSLEGRNNIKRGVKELKKRKRDNFGKNGHPPCQKVTNNPFSGAKRGEAFEENRKTVDELLARQRQKIELV